MRSLDAERDIRITSRLRRGSADPTHVFGRGGGQPLANVSLVTAHRAPAPR